jgi:hypothetical protein
VDESGGVEEWRPREGGECGGVEESGGVEEWRPKKWRPKEWRPRWVQNFQFVFHIIIYIFLVFPSVTRGVSEIFSRAMKTTIFIILK